MSLVVDRTPTLAGPGLHALIIGVSAYPDLPVDPGGLRPEHFGMTRLSSAALAAFRVYEWLIHPATRLPVPLLTCRLLLLPSAEELTAEPALRPFAAPWNTANALGDLRDWRDAASCDRRGMTFFYFAGHGAQRSIGDSVLLLPGFGNGVPPYLANAIDTANIFAGMAPTDSRAGIARTQLYFVDACRLQPEKFRNFEKLQTAAAWDVELNAYDDRQAPIFFAAVPGSVANGIRGQQSLFSAALLDALRGSGAQALEEDANGKVPWAVSVHSLDAALADGIRELNTKFRASQEYTPGGALRDAPICYLDGPPSVEVTVRVEPSPAETFGRLEVLDNCGQPVWNAAPPADPHPYSKSLPAGNYTLRVAFPPGAGPFKPFMRSRPINPLPRRLQLTARCC